jgi:hypothetical protein
MWNIYTMDYYSAINKNEIMPAKEGHRLQENRLGRGLSLKKLGVYFESYTEP